MCPLLGVDHHRAAIFIASEHLKELQPLGGGLRIRQYHIRLALRSLQLGKDARGGIPHRKLRSEGLLGF